jgi:CarboxypepD_reg-like domain
MKKKFFTFIAIATSIISFSQESQIKGIITDSLHKPIPYVNIGVLNKPIGTVSNQNGEFYLNLDNSMYSDTIKISCLGYKTVKKKINQIDKNTYNVSLLNYVDELKEVVIKSNQLKTYTEGKDKTNASSEVFFAIPGQKNLNLGSEVGRKFSLGSKKPSLLNEFKFFIKQNNFEAVKFRINVYSILKNKPNQKLNQENIIINVNGEKGWINVDLSQYDIKVQEDIIIAVEWIECSKVGGKLSLPICIPSFSSTHYYKFGTQAQWQKYGSISAPMVLTYKQ